MSRLLHLAAPEPYFLSHCLALLFFFSPSPTSVLSSSTSILKRSSSSPEFKVWERTCTGKRCCNIIEAHLVKKKTKNLHDLTSTPLPQRFSFDLFARICAVQVSLPWSLHAIKRIGRISNVSQEEEEEAKAATAAAGFWSGLPAENCLFRLRGGFKCFAASVHSGYFAPFHHRTFLLFFPLAVNGEEEHKSSSQQSKEPPSPFHLHILNIY